MSQESVTPKDGTPTSYWRSGEGPPHSRRGLRVFSPRPLGNVWGQGRKRAPQVAVGRGGEGQDEDGGNRMGFIAWIVIGAIAGALGKLIMPGRDPGGIIVTILIGMAGALVGGFIVQGLLGLGGGGFIWSILVATLGAIVLLAIYRLIVGQRRA